MIPNRKQVLEKAIEMFHIERARNGDPSFNITPTEQELKENGFIQSAMSQLMSNMHKATLENDYLDYPQEFSVDLQELFESNALILGSRHVGKSDIAMMICDKAIEHDAIVVIFDPSTDWIARSNIPRFVKIEPYRLLEVPSESVIYDISLLAPNQSQRIVENFAKKLFESQVMCQNRKQHLVVFEEAHTYFSQGCMRAKALANCVRLVSVGRNVNISCLLVSQFASLLDKFVVKHSLSQAWFGFTREPNDLKYLKQILGKNSEYLTKLESGEFLFLDRTGVNKVVVESYETKVQKHQISTPQLEPINLPKPKQNNVVAWFIAFLVWLVSCSILLSLL